jgi:hypothetical protein
MIFRLGAMAVICAATTVAAQSASSSARAKLLADARDGTSQYWDVKAAIGDGYKRVGVEFPAMGEHWVSLARVLENKFDARRPSVLIYITTHGKRELAGVGYTALLADGQQPPRTAAQLTDWHEHNGSVVDESLPVHGHAEHSSLPPEAAALGATRLAILHVWAWRRNPAGAFVTENWSLPVARLGGATPHLGAAAVRAVSLANDSASYYEQTLTNSLHLTTEEARRAHAVIDAGRRAARAQVMKHALDDETLGAIWSGVWAELERDLPTRVKDLRAIRAKL